MKYALLTVFFLAVLIYLNAGLSQIKQIKAIEEDNRSIQSEIRDAQWITACDDMGQQAYPQTFADCNN